MPLTITGTPARGCTCKPCSAMRLRIWRTLTPRRRAALQALASGPRTPRDLAVNSGIRTRTWQPMSPHPMDPAPRLIGGIRLRQWTNDSGTDFLTLTELGREVLATGQRYERRLG